MVAMQSLPEPDAAQLAADRRFVFAVARRIVGDREAASDVTQDAMLAAFRHRDSFRGDARYRTWLYRIATTAALGHLRRERSQARRINASGREALAPLTPAPRTPIEELTAAETERAVAGHVRELPRQHREILALRFYDGCSEVEAAAALGVSKSAVKLRTHRAKHALRAQLPTTIARRR
jgi:RNA polymerase sigma-70 factor, ECF subfamily